MRERTGTSLRALASPVAVVSLVLLVLNDHLLKQAWPGVLTGKLSDVAGLVLAPLLLTVGLAAVGVRRPSTWACGLTAAGFTAVKLSPSVAAVASGWWSLTGFPTGIRADPTDLLALPAVYVACLVHRRVRRQRPVEWRRLVATATGIALVPLGVVATAATSCLEYDGVDQVWVAGGTWASAPAGLDHRLAVHSDQSILSIDAEGVVTALPQADSSRLDSHYGGTPISCDGAGSCWRIGDSAVPVVEVSADYGLTWTTEVSMTRKEAEDAAKGVDTGCGGDPVTRLVDVAVLPVEDGTEVAVAAKQGGVLLRSSSGDWRRISHQTLEAMRPVEVTETPGGFIGTVQDELPPGYPTPGTPEPPTPGTPTPSGPPCTSPTRRTVTPNPSNGPPTSYDVCP
jgi:hypothetical protein